PLEGTERPPGERRHADRAGKSGAHARAEPQQPPHRARAAQRSDSEAVGARKKSRGFVAPAALCVLLVRTRTLNSPCVTEPVPPPTVAPSYFVLLTSNF